MNKNNNNLQDVIDREFEVKDIDFAISLDEAKVKRSKLEKNKTNYSNWPVVIEQEKEFIDCNEPRKKAKNILPDTAINNLDNSLDIAEESLVDGLADNPLDIAEERYVDRWTDSYYVNNSLRGFSGSPKVATKSSIKYMEPILKDYEDADLLPALEESQANLPIDIEQFEEVHNGLNIIRVSERTLIYCIVVDKKNEENVVANLRCYGGIAFGGYARDVSGDAYMVECVQAIKLGSIPFSYKLKMEKVGNWSTKIPIPEKVLDMVFSPSQKKTLMELRERFPSERYDIHYLQMSQIN